MTTQFHNHTNAALADEIGEINAELKALQAREKALKAEFKARGLEEVDTGRFRITLTQAIRWSLDAKRLKSEMGEAWYDARCRMASVASIRVGASQLLGRAAA